MARLKTHRIALLAAAAIVLSGCTSTTRPADFPAQHVTSHVPETTSYPGLQLDGEMTGAGTTLTATAKASNAGPRTYHVETGCTTPWSEQLLRDGPPLAMREPTPVCQSYALRDLPPNGTVERTFAWNGTSWDDARHRYTAAASGAYTWSVRFVAYSPDGAALKRFDLDFPVTVG